MDHARVVLGLSMSVLLAACNNGGATADQGAEPAHTDVTADHRGAPTTATVGPVRYQFDATQLIMAEVLVQVPPGNGDRLWGAKLIPIARADVLGQELCEYTRPGRLETCETAKEAGLALMLLERPLDHYRQAFVDRGLGDELIPAQLDDSRGFGFTAEREGSRIEYRFLPLEDRTMLLARHFIDGQDAGAEAIEEVIRSVERGLEAAHR